MADKLTPATDAATRAREIAIKHALPGIYDGISTHATRRGDADGRPYMMALREALTKAASQPREGDGEVEQLRHKLWMIACHATGGGIPEIEGIDRSVNDICVQISASRNLVYQEGKEQGAKEALTQRPPEQAGAVPAGMVDNLTQNQRLILLGRDLDIESRRARTRARNDLRALRLMWSEGHGFTPLGDAVIVMLSAAPTPPDAGLGEATSRDPSTHSPLPRE